jgi:hypothetical protein
VKEDYICGNLGLDPLKIIENDDEEAFLSYRNKVRATTPQAHTGTGSLSLSLRRGLILSLTGSCPTSSFRSSTTAVWL